MRWYILLKKRLTLSQHLIGRCPLRVHSHITSVVKSCPFAIGMWGSGYYRANFHVAATEVGCYHFSSPSPAMEKAEYPFFAG